MEAGASQVNLSNTTSHCKIAYPRLMKNTLHTGLAAQARYGILVKTESPKVQANPWVQSLTLNLVQVQ